MSRSCLFVLFVLLLTLQKQCDITDAAAESRNKFPNDASEIARQNKITEQILAQFIQRKFFPHLSPPVRPSIYQSSGQEDPDTLETVESEQIPNVYDEEKKTISE